MLKPEHGRARNYKPEPGPSPTFIFEARFRPENQIYLMSEDTHTYGASKNVVFGYS